MAELRTSRLGTSRLSRIFGNVTALDEVTVDFRRQTIHALLGENGAGKTTLIKSLSGLDRADSGAVLIDGEPVTLSGPHDAFNRGVAVVQQELAMCPDLTLLENLVLGHEPMSRGQIDWRTARQRAEEIAGSIGVEIPWDRRAGDTVIGTLQLAEIIRCLFRGADTLLLDEPSAVLAPSQVKGLLELLTRLRAEGTTIVLITHKLEEALSICDDVTVLRGGRVVHSGQVADLSRDDLARHVVGDDVPTIARTGPRDCGTEVLVLEGVVVTGRSQSIGPVDLTVRQGEVVGIAGVAGNGQDELLEAVVGLRPLAAGRMYLDQEDVSGRWVGERRARGLGYISADRRHEGLSVTEPLVDNVVFGNHCRPPISGGWWMSRARMKMVAGELLDRFHVRYGRVGDPALSLSGGNQQKAVFGRELSRSPSLLVASQPTRGVDIKGINELHSHLLTQRGAGCAILLMSQELDELLALSDRILVMFRGQVVESVKAADPSARERIGRAMLGREETPA